MAFVTHVYITALNALAARLTSLLQEADDDDLLRVAERLAGELDAHRGRQSISLAFVGQFSAGKSTLISALTGRRDIGIDADIATDRVTSYAWTEGLALIDTPGLYTERKEHDGIAEEALRTADLIVYCITYSLFDHVTAPNFRHLAFERGYQPKMMLVINKMSSEAGERGQLIGNYEESLDAALAPHSVRRFRRAYVDAKDYIDGVDEEDPELVEDSFVADLVSGLNAMAKEQGVLGKLDAPARMLLGAIDEAEVVVAPGEGTDKAYLLTLDRLSRAVRNERREFRATIRGVTVDLTQQIVELGQGLASRAGENKDLEAECAAAAEHIRQLVGDASNRATEVAETSAQTIQRQIAKVLDGEVVQAMFGEVDVDGLGVDAHVPQRADFSQLRSRLGKLRTVGGAVADRVLNLAQGPGHQAAQGFLRAGQAAGGGLHKMVYGIGSLLGHKFRPWQAVNFAKNLGNVAKAAGPILAAVGSVADVYIEKREKETEEKLAHARGEIRGGFLNTAREVELEFETKLRDEFEKSVFDAADAAISEARVEFEQEVASTSELQAALRDTRVSAKALLASLR